MIYIDEKNNNDYLSRGILFIKCEESRLDIHSRSEFTTALNYYTEKYLAKTIVVDLETVEYMDSCVLGILIHTLLESRKKNINLLLYRISPHVSKILEMVKCKELFKITESLDEI